MSLQKAAPTSHAIFNKNVWMSFDRNGGVIEYTTSSKRLITHDNGLRLKTITDIAVFKGNLFITSKFEGIFMYDSIRDQWKNCTPFGIFKDSNFFALEASDDMLVASGCEGMLYYTKDGIPWNKVSTYFRSCITTVRLINDSWWLSADNSTIFKYDKSLNTKTELKNLPVKATNMGFVSIEEFQGKIYAINQGESIIVSSDSGVTWQTVTKNKPWIYSAKLYPIHDHLYLNEYYSGLYEIENNHTFKPVFENLIEAPKEKEKLSMVIEYEEIRIFCSSGRIIVIH